MLGFLEDDVEHLVVGRGSIIFSVKFDFFGEHRTKEFDFDFRLRPAEELPQIVDEIDGVGELVLDLQVFAYPECLNPVP